MKWIKCRIQSEWYCDFCDFLCDFHKTDGATLYHLNGPRNEDGRADGPTICGTCKDIFEIPNEPDPK